MSSSARKHSDNRASAPSDRGTGPGLGITPGFVLLAVSASLIIFSSVGMAVGIGMESSALQKRYDQMQPDAALQQKLKAAGLVLAPGVVEVGCLPAESRNFWNKDFVENCWTSSYEIRENPYPREFSPHDVVFTAPLRFIHTTFDSSPDIAPRIGFRITRSDSGKGYAVRSFSGATPITEAEVASIVAEATSQRSQNSADKSISVDSRLTNLMQAATAQ